MTTRERIQAIQNQISQSARASGRPQGSVRLIAVSKTHPAESVREAYQYGLRDFGENYADELATKQTQLSDLTDIRWIFIGQLQSNKIQTIVRHADEIQSIATEKHARYVDRYARELGKSGFPVWIVVNAGNEESKQGQTFISLPQLALFIQKECPHLTLRGIMAIPPATFSDASWRASPGQALPELYTKLRAAANATGEGLLSLGMTGDLDLAINSGSDCVRIGTAIFGVRQPQQVP